MEKDPAEFQAKGVDFVWLIETYDPTPAQVEQNVDAH
jgi:hypothetical protein